MAPCWMSGARRGPFRRRFAARSRRATRGAASPAAPRAGATPTTWSIGPTAVRRASTTWCCCAAAITARSTRAASRSGPCGRRVHVHRTGWNANPSGAIPAASGVRTPDRAAGRADSGVGRDARRYRLGSRRPAPTPSRPRKPRRGRETAVEAVETVLRFPRRLWARSEASTAPAASTAGQAGELRQSGSSVRRSSRRTDVDRA